MKKIVVSVVVGISSMTGIAQQNVLDHFKNMNMRAIGPAVMSGRVTAIDVRDDNPDIIYAGTASGGLWLSESGGISWKPLFDREPVHSIGALSIDPSNPDVIWAGTGEGNPRNSQSSGNGIYKSPDGGRSWKNMGLEATKTIHRILMHPRFSSTLYVAAHGSAWGPTPDRGVYRTNNGGESWEKILFVNDSVGCADLVMDPQNPNKLFAAMWHYGRKPWTFDSGGKGSGLHMTVDGGKTWTQLSDKNGLPEGEIGRIGLAIAPSNPKVVYALIESKKTALYKSTDGGYNWKMITDKDVDDRPFYYHEIYVDPTNENRIIYLHSTVSESLDGGKTFHQFVGWEVHPDHHAFWWSAEDPSYMIEGNDGGMNITRDNGKTWQFVNNLPLGQFYHINYDMDIPYHVYGGMQDNGSWKGPGYTWNSGSISAADWQEVLFGDGFDVVPYANDSRFVYAMYQGGEVYWVDSETGESRYIKPVHPDGVKLRYHWNAGISADPYNADGLFYGSQFVHFSPDKGNSWKIISPDLSTNDSTKLKQAESGGLTLDVTTAENHCTIICIAPSSLDKDVVWAGTDDGNIQVTTDGGKTWRNCSNGLVGLPKGAWVPQIVASTHKAGEAFAVVNNYRQNDWKPYLFHTTDFGKSWKNLVTGSGKTKESNEKAVDGHCLTIVQDPVEPKLLFLGTEHGLYISFDYGTTWNKWTHNYPAGVATQDLKIHPREHDLIIATFGRAAFILDDIRPLRALAQKGKTIFDKKLTAFETPTAYMANYKQPLGERFHAALHFNGDNKWGGAMLNYYFKVEEEKKGEKTEDERPKAKKENAKPVEKKEVTEHGEPKTKKEKAMLEEKEEVTPADSTDKKKDEKPKDKKVKVSILSMAGDTLRWFLHEPDTGINILSWGFDTEGVRSPSRKERKPDDDQRGNGPQVAPGNYKVVFTFNEHKDSTTVRVEADPRIPFDILAYDKQVELAKRWQDEVKKADKAFEQLKLVKKNIELAKTSWVNVPDSLKKEVLAEADSLSKKISGIEKLFMAPEDENGIRDDSQFLSSKIWGTSGYLNTGHTAPGENSEIAVRLFADEVKKVVDKVNTFISTDYEAWKEKAEKVEVKLFKEIED
ncbi:MAG: hypothetical protein SH856_02980 [Flavobacteriales bacterium]|nr:hypothetical protein [Flavobacteriales bacterium]